MTIQFAAEEDTGLILRFIKELADYEGMLSEVEATEPLPVSYTHLTLPTIA